MKVLVLLVVLLWARPSDACVRAAEASKLVGWSEDGAYSLLLGADHAELLPTSYAGFVYVIVDSGEGTVIVTKTKVGACASFGGDGGTIIETKQGTLTEQLLGELAIVKELKIGMAEVVPSKPPIVPAATISGAKRYDVHDLVIDGKTLPVPVWCVGSCLVDESWKKWTATVAEIHTLANGVVLYVVKLANVCHGGDLLRVIKATPASTKPPKSRCKGGN